MCQLLLVEFPEVPDGRMRLGLLRRRRRPGR